MTNNHSDPIKNSTELSEFELISLINRFRLAVRVLTAWEDAECAGCQNCEACRDLNAFAWDEVNAYMPTRADGSYDFELMEYVKRALKLHQELTEGFLQISFAELNNAYWKEVLRPFGRRIKINNPSALNRYFLGDDND